MKKEELEVFIEKGLSIRGISEASGIPYSNVRYWLKLYKLSTIVPKYNKGGVGPKRLHRELGHRCKCGETDPSKFYGKKYSLCGKCQNTYNTEKGREKRLYVINKLGGKCVYCGYSKYHCSLDTHHLDPAIKDPDFKGLRGWSYERIDKEIESCILLCRNCHAAVHSGFITI